MYRVLLVDDEKIIRMGMQKGIAWKQAGIGQALAAESAEEALEMLNRQQIHILVTDIQMGGMTGLELINRVNEKYPQIKIVVLTGYDEFEYARKCLKMQVEDFLLKPVDEDDMVTIIKRQVDKIKAEEKQQKSAVVMRRVIGSNEQIQLNQMMRDLLRDQDAVQAAASQLCDKFSYDRQQLMQIAVLIPPVSQYEKQEEDGYFALALRDFCNNNIDLREAGVTFLDDQDRIVIAYFLDNSNDNISQRLEAFTQLLKDEFGIIQKIVVGSVVTGFVQLRISYNDAMFLLEEEQQGYRNIILNRQRQNKDHIFWEVFGEIKDTIAANQGESETIMRVFAAFCKMTESYHLSTEHVRRCCFELAMAVYYSHIVNNGEVNGEIVRAYTAKIVSSERELTLAETKIFIKGMLHKEAETIHNLVDQAQIYIQNHLAQELSVTAIAQMLFVTPAYFSRLFKKVTKERCNDYIVRLRMEKAQDLLESTNMKTGKIALAVGYQDKNYFSLAFKKFKGVSPTVYREQSRVLE